MTILLQGDIVIFKTFIMQNSLRNKVTLIGNVGAKPEMVAFKENRKLARFSLATNEYYTNDKGEKQQSTQWHNVVAWGKTAQIIEQYVNKGQELAVEGKLTSRSYETKEGEKRYITEVVANEILMLGK